MPYHAGVVDVSNMMSRRGKAKKFSRHLFDIDIIKKKIAFHYPPASYF